MTKKVYIVILNYNGWKDTIECLESVLKSDYVNYQIIVVDNGSSNDSMKYIVNWAEGSQEVVYPIDTKLKYLTQPCVYKPLKYHLYSQYEVSQNTGMHMGTQEDVLLIFIQSEENRGFASGNNIGIKYALSQDDCEYVWLLNNDTVLEVDTLSQLIHSFAEKSKKQNLAILGNTQYYYSDPTKIQATAGGFNRWLGKFWNYDSLDITQDEIAYVYGASMFIKKDFFLDVGLLNEEYFMYYEEIDLAEKMKDHNYRMDIDTTIGIYHKHGATTGTLDSDFRTYYLEKNKIVFYKNHYKSLLFIPFLTILRNMLKMSIENKKIKGVYFRSLWDGYLK